MWCAIFRICLVINCKYHRNLLKDVPFPAVPKLAYDSCMFLSISFLIENYHPSRLDPPILHGYLGEWSSWHILLSYSK